MRFPFSNAKDPHNKRLSIACAVAVALVGSLALATRAHAGPSDPGHGVLTVIVEGIESATGIVGVQVLAGEAQFNGEGSAASALLPAREGTTSVTFGALPSGEYAVRVMHDVDSDGKLKTNMVGMPKEPWGISNNATGNFGPPKWEAARFELTGEVQQIIRLR